MNIELNIIIERKWSTIRFNNYFGNESIKHGVTATIAKDETIRPTNSLQLLHEARNKAISIFDDMIKVEAGEPSEAIPEVVQA